MAPFHKQVDRRAGWRGMHQLDSFGDSGQLILGQQVSGQPVTDREPVKIAQSLLAERANAWLLDALCQRVNRGQGRITFRRHGRRIGLVLRVVELITCAPGPDFAKAANPGALAQLVFLGRVEMKKAHHQKPAVIPEGYLQTASATHDQVRFHNLPCGKLDQFPILEINKIIEKEIKLFCPDTILSHSSVDANSDHRRINESVIMATRPGALNFVERVLFFEVLSSTEWKFSNSFLPNYFVQLRKKDAENKVKSMKQYKSEVADFPFPRSEEGILSMLKVRGMQSGSEYAEAFETLRIIKK